MILMSFLTSTLGGDPEDYRRLLESARSCSNKQCLEFVLVVQNDCLAFKEYQCLVEEYSELNLNVYYQDGLGLSRGRNYAASMSSGKYFFFYDDDCWITGKDFDFLVSVFGSVSPDVLFTDYVNGQHVFHECDRSYFISNENRISRLYGKPSITIAIQKELFDLVGGFDEHIGLGTLIPSGEETDLLFRIGIWKKEVTVCFVEGVSVCHNITDADRKDADKYYGYGVGDGALIRKFSPFDWVLYLIFIRSVVKDLCKALLGFGGLKSTLNLRKVKGRLVGFFT